MLAMQTFRLETSAFEVIQTSFGTTWLIRMGITIALLAVWFLIERKSSISKKIMIPLLVLSLCINCNYNNDWSWISQ